MEDSTKNPNVDGLYACDLCDYKGATKKYLAKHRKRCHSDPTIKCKLCPKLFHYTSHMTKHLLVHMGEKPYKCSECGKDFNRLSSLRTHGYIHSNLKPFTCDMCPYACRDSSTLRKHKEDHHLSQAERQSRRYRCSVCDKSLKSKRSLKIHVAEKHLNIDVKIYQCSICNKRFKLKQVLNLHVKTVHDRLMTTKCPICQKTLASAYNLPGHLKIVHSDDRPYKCMEKGCNKLFKDNGDLKKHTIIHFPEKHFPCEKCGKTFSRKHRMVTHMLKIHGPPRKRKINHLQLVCDYCGFVARSRPGMAQHIKNLHLYKKRCKICLKAYKHNNALVRHYTNSHGINYKRALKTESILSEPTEEKVVKCEPSNPQSDTYIDNMGKDIKLEPKDDVQIDLFEIEKEEDLQDLFYESESPQSDDDNREAEKVIDNIEQAIDDIEAAKRLRESEISVHINDLADVLDQLCDTGVIEDSFFFTYSQNISEENQENKIKEPIEKTDLEKKDRMLLDDGNKNFVQNTSQKPDTENNLNTSQKPDTENNLNTSQKPDTENNLNTSQKPDSENNFNTSQKPDTENNLNTSQKPDTENNLNKPKTVITFEAKTHKKQNNKIVYKNREDIKIAHNVQSFSKEEAKNLIAKNVNNLRNVPDAVFDAFFIQNPVKKVKERITIPKNNTRVDENDTFRGDDVTTSNNTQPKKNPSKSTRKKSKKSKTVNKDPSKPRNNIKYHQPKVDYSVPKKEYFIDESISSVYNTRKRRYDYKDEVINCNDDFNDVNTDYDDDQMFKNEIESDDETIVKKAKKNNKRKKKEKVTEEAVEKIIEERKRKMKKPKINEEKKGVLSNNHQCYVCFKMFDTKEKLIDHCKDHFDICNEINLKKCPLCDFVCTGIYLAKHMKLIHKVNIYNKTNAMLVKDRKDTSKGSRYYIEVTNDEVFKEIDVIPSIKNLNRLACINLDKKRREDKDKMIGKEKLVKKKEWVVETEKQNLDNVFVPKIDVELPGDEYMDKIRNLYFKAKKQGKTMMFPCQNCDKICQTFSALKLHKRRHDPNKKPFRKHKIRKLVAEIAKRQGKIDAGENSGENPATNENGDQEIQETSDKIPTDKGKETSDKITDDKEVSDKNKKANKEKAQNRNKKPAPIVNKHKCSPELKSFYENNIRGDNIEFWQFLKIHNKMERENIKDFVDLETRDNNDFGLHVPVVTNDEKSTEKDDNSSKICENSWRSDKKSGHNKNPSKSTKNGSKNVTSNKNENLTSDERIEKSKLDKSSVHSKKTDVIRKNLDISKLMSSTKSLQKFNFNRISKQTYLRRERIKEMLREKYKDKSLLLNQLKEKYSSA